MLCYRIWAVCMALSIPLSLRSPNGLLWELAALEPLEQQEGHVGYLLLLISLSEGVGKKTLIFKSCPEGRYFNMPWLGKGKAAVFPGVAAVSWWCHRDASHDPFLCQLVSMEMSLVCLQEQEDFHSREGHQELAKMGTSRNSHSEIQSRTGAAFQDQVRV